MNLGLVAGVTGLIAAGIGLYVMLYAMDFLSEIRGPIILTVEDSGWERVPATAKRHATYKSRTP
ncbi:hypothetical protein [[Eubacterium] cellulosolvens]